MKKLRFALQVFVLIAAFPVLFIAGITHHKDKAEDIDAKKEEPATINEVIRTKEYAFVSTAGQGFYIKGTY